MNYNIQQLAKAANISIRTLRYYDQIGLLVPKARMMNGRRYYGIEELLSLVKMLMLKDLGFSLQKIQELVQESPKYKICALKAQKKILIQERERIDKCLMLIETMICQEDIMFTHDNAQQLSDVLKNRQEYVQMFDEAYRREKLTPIYEQFRLEVGNAYYEAWQSKVNGSAALDAAVYGGKMGQFFGEIATLRAKGLSADSPEVQQLMPKHWENLQLVFPKTDSKKIYLAIRDQVCGKHLRLPDPTGEAGRQMDYISEAMTVFADGHFSEN